MSGTRRQEQFNRFSGEQTLDESLELGGRICRIKGWGTEATSDKFLKRETQDKHLPVTGILLAFQPS